MADPLKTVAVAVQPLPNPQLTLEEDISMRHLIHFLGKYDKYLIIPEGLKLDLPGFGIKRFPRRFFGSTAAHNKLMLSARFYEAFKGYKYILDYHLDALVFSDQLMEWCETDVDYIGAPWIKCEEAAWVKMPRVGNGGFSLRKVDSFLKVICSKRYLIDPDKYWSEFCASNPKWMQYLNLPRKYLKRLRIFNGARWHMAKLRCNDDMFFSDYARKYYPEFKVASFETGLRFAFEVAPRVCFDLNKRTLPFGCHAWARYDRKFWEAYLLDETQERR